MEKNKINDNQTSPKKIITENSIESFINKTTKTLNKNKDIRISGKILHYGPQNILYYNCITYKKTKINPYNCDIIFGYEFIPNEIPYITILTDFLIPSLKDNRNFYYCLTNNFNYKFSLDHLDEHFKIIENIIKNTPIFLDYVKSCSRINSFIFFGEYRYNHLYQINDFLQHDSILNFYRINQLINDKFEEKYIVITRLYFLFFEPLKNNKSLAYLKYSKKLKDLELDYEKGPEEKNTLILKIKTNKISDIEFVFINREKTSCKNYSIFMKNMFIYQDSIDFSKYSLVINKYKLLFNHNTFKVNVNSIKLHKKISEYEKMIAFNEKVIEYYEENASKKSEDQILKYISNIIFLCTELVGFHDDNEKANLYLNKMKNYMDISKK